LAAPSPIIQNAGQMPCLGQFDARLEFPIRLRELALGVDARRGVTTPGSFRAAVILFDGLDRQHAVLDVEILRPVSVILSDVISTEAGARFVTSEDSIRQLRQKLGLRRGESMPHFEVLLKTQVVNDSIPRFELVAYRPRKKG